MIDLKVLIVDDDKNICKALSLSLKTTDCYVAIASSVDEAIVHLKREKFDVVLSDFKMDKKTGLDLLAEIKSVQRDLIVIIMTAFSSVDNAVAVMKGGAFDYLPKPFTNDQLLTLLKNIQIYLRTEDPPEHLKSLDEVEKAQIIEVLMHERNLERASKILGITVPTLWRKRKQYNLD